MNMSPSFIRITGVLMEEGALILDGGNTVKKELTQGTPSPGTCMKKGRLSIIPRRAYL
jgi:hypothetical protein